MFVKAKKQNLLLLISQSIGDIKVSVYKTIKYQLNIEKKV